MNKVEWEWSGRINVCTIYLLDVAAQLRYFRTRMSDAIETHYFVFYCYRFYQFVALLPSQEFKPVNVIGVKTFRGYDSLLNLFTDVCLLDKGKICKLC